MKKRFFTISVFIISLILGCSNEQIEPNGVVKEVTSESQRDAAPFSEFMNNPDGDYLASPPEGYEPILGVEEGYSSLALYIPHDGSDVCELYVFSDPVAYANAASKQKHTYHGSSNSNGGGAIYCDGAADDCTRSKGKIVIIKSDQ